MCDNILSRELRLFPSMRKMERSAHSGLKDCLPVEIITLMLLGLCYIINDAKLPRVRGKLHLR